MNLRFVPLMFNFAFRLMRDYRFIDGTIDFWVRVNPNALNEHVACQCVASAEMWEAWL